MTDLIFNLQAPAGSCRCQKSKCGNSYCPCRKAGRQCGDSCSCADCQNRAQTINANPVQATIQATPPLVNNTGQTGQEARNPTNSQPKIRDLFRPREEEKRTSTFMQPSYGDPHRKIEDRCIAIRTKKKKEKIQHKREALYQARNLTSNLNSDSNVSCQNIQCKKIIRVMALNVRGLASEIKKNKLRKSLNDGRYDVAGLTETRLKRPLFLKGAMILQTKNDSKGGSCSVSFQPKQTRNIKYIQNSIAYQSVAYYNCPVHILTCYFSPNQEDHQKTREQVQHLKSMIINIFGNFRKSRVIVMGDFNQKWIDEVKQFLASYQMIPVLANDVPTYSLGHQLDQIFTNIPVVSSAVQTVDFSDHQKVTAELDLTVTKEDLNLRQIPTFHSQKQIRRAAQSEKLKQKLINHPSIIYRPILEQIQGDIPKSKRVGQWYRPPPKWFLAKEPRGQQELREVRNAEWEKLMRSIEAAHRQNDLKQFHFLIRRATQIKKSGNPIEGLIEDVTGAIENCNFNKGLGPDAFDGSILKEQRVRDAVAHEITQMLNTGVFPPHLREVRLVLLSKKANQSVVEVSETRPIVVNSHLYKICEKTIAKKIEDSKSQLLKVGSYQQGFKKGASTHVNVTKLLEKKEKTLAYILVDLKKAYDSVFRSKLFEILEMRCQTNLDKELTSLIRELASEPTLVFNSRQIQALRGVVQGGGLSPQLFNVYLDEALKSDPTLRRLMTIGNLLAFADDLLIKVSSVRDFRETIKALQSLEETYGLRLNLEKTVFLSKAKEFANLKEVEGVKRVEHSKYLGVEVSLDRQHIIEESKSRIRKQMGYFKSRVRINDPKILSELYTAYLRSLLIYFMTPLVSVKLFSSQQVDRLEAQMRRDLLHLPNDIKSSIIQNTTAQYRIQTSAIVARLAERARLKATMQSTLRPLSDPASENTIRALSSHRKLYVERGVLDLMLAVTQKRTVISYNRVHFCKEHGQQVDKRHLAECSLLREAGDVTRFIPLLERNQHIKNGSKGPA